MEKALKTGIVYDESYNWHETGAGKLNLNALDKDLGAEWIENSTYYDNTGRIRPIKNLLDKSGFIKELTAVDPRPITREELLYYHTSEYIDLLKELSDNAGGLAGFHCVIGRGSFEIILLAVGGALAGLDAVMEGKVRNSFSLSRPPAGHALSDQGSGFCPVNTFNILVHYAKKKYSIKQVAIVDWDSHNKDPIAEEWYEDPEVLYIETHQRGTFGHVGAENVGKGAGRGYTVPIPLPVGTGDDGYIKAFEEIVVPITDQFKPELIILVNGYAANIYDPLGGQQITSRGYKKMAEMVKRVADRNCDGRLVAVMEGGAGHYMPLCFMNVIETFSGIKSLVQDPYQPAFAKFAKVNALTIDQANSIDNVKKIQSEFWKL